MKHAYLIIAHNEFQQLQRLVEALDDSRNDIFIHIDKKVKNIPPINVRKSKLMILNNRIDIRWGHTSQIKAEYLLLKSAFYYKSYDYYHIISGTHYPLVNIDKIDRFFQSCNGASVVIPMETTREEDIFRVGFRHLFMKSLTYHKGITNKIFHLLWRIALYPQKKLGISRDISFIGPKLSNWCSLSREAVKEALKKEEFLLKKFRASFCSDEYLVGAILKGTLLPVKFNDKLLFLRFSHGNASVLTEHDYAAMMASGCIFGRKFTEANTHIIERIRNEKN